MAETVGQHAVAAFTSPVNGSTPIDANTVRGNDNTIRVAYVDHDADPGIHVQSSALASRPIAGVAGRKWMTVDGTVTRLWYDTGSTWLEMQSSALSTARTLWGQSFDGTANVSGNLSSVGNIAMTGALSGATSLSATSVSATNVTGTLQTAAQPNVTSVGTLSSLAVSGTGTATNWHLGATQGRVGFANENASLILRDSASPASTISFNTGGSEKMRLDASGNLGLGVTPSAWGAGFRVLQIGGATSLSDNGANDLYLATNARFDGSVFKYLTSNVANYYTQENGAHAWHNAPSGTAGNAITFTQAMTLDASGNLGVGTTSPDIFSLGSTNLTVQGAFTRSRLNLVNSDAVSVGAVAGTILWGQGTTPYAQIDGLSVGAVNSGNLVFRTASAGSMAERMRLDATGNLGLGVTPSAWGAAYRTAQISSGAIGSSTTNNAVFTSNTFWNGTAWVYIATDTATFYQQTAGQHRWFNAASGTAGNAISFTQAMTLDASGNLLVGTTTATGAAASRGLIVVNGLTAGSAAVNLTVNNTWTGTYYADTGGVTLGVVANLPLLFTTNNTERARFDTSGNFGIGTTPLASDGRLTIQNGTSDPALAFKGRNTDDAAAIRWWSNDGLTQRASMIYATDSAGMRLITAGSNPIRFETANTVRWSVSSAGNLLAGADATYDIGASGATRPRNIFISDTLVSGAVRVGASSAGVAGTTTIGNGTATTVGATGAAAALPANPLGYIIAHVGTTQVKIPYYTA